MRILITSDLHGRLPNIKEPFDLLLICGDVCPPHDHYYSFQDEWMKNEFCNWVNTLPFKDNFSKVIMTWGNHDFIGERYNKKENNILYQNTNSRLIILKNATYDFEYVTNNGINTLKIFGTPYCHIFGNWAFMVSDENLKVKYNKCPKNVDIFISHDSPTINGLGKINEGFQAGHDAGNKVLSDAIIKKMPKFFFSGHIHSGNHTFEKIGETRMANVSYINERYAPYYPILALDMQENSIKESYIDCELKELY